MPKVKDPVCGMLVDPEKTSYRYEYKGKTYYFCCPHCLETFKQNPEKYVGEKKEEKENK